MKNLFAILILLIAFSFSITLLGNESVKEYFPTPLGSYWVYVDEDKNELTRHAVEEEEIAGETYQAFSYEPELEELFYFNRYMHPTLYQVNENGITFVFEDEIEKALKAQLKKETEIFIDVFEKMATSEGDVDFQLAFDIEVEKQDQLYLLPEGISVNEEWDVIQIGAKIKMEPTGTDASGPDEIIFDFTINETGNVLGIEAVKTSAGTFEECLKIEYRTETTLVVDPADDAPDLDLPGETVTTLWFAPNVGIVKLNQVLQPMFLEIIPDDADLPIPREPQVRTSELKKYEIKSDKSEGE